MTVFKERNSSSKSKIKVNKKHIILVGSLPPPVGGITSHIVRLSSFLVEHGFRCSVIDTYPNDGKMSIRGVEHLICRGVGHFRVMMWLLFVVGLRRRGDIVHLHFSRAVGHFLFSLFMFKRGRKIFLTLHHGNQDKIMKNTFWPLRIVTVFALKRMDKIVALSDEQLMFYRSLKIDSDRIVRWSSALPINFKAEPQLLPNKVRKLTSVEAGGNETILMTSGYPMRSYGYEECIELLDHLSTDIPCWLIVSLYGIGSDPAYERKLRSKLLQHPKVILLGPLPAEGFLALLSKVSIYLRPSSVDSYGLAITDALDMGTPCLASDICSRDPRCEIFPLGEKEKFITKATNIVKQGRNQSKNKTFEQIPQKEFDIILKCYQE